mmetsp:Transcript_8893/g.22179  ORF Transcript_8893/g.22179 Transcript_8893/m.22179 type:complete len:295 (-) Transcript_8893:2447-3331(-)
MAASLSTPFFDKDLLAVELFPHQLLFLARTPPPSPATLPPSPPASQSTGGREKLSRSESDFIGRADRTAAAVAAGSAARTAAAVPALAAGANPSRESLFRATTGLGGKIELTSRELGGISEAFEAVTRDDLARPHQRFLGGFLTLVSIAIRLEAMSMLAALLGPAAAMSGRRSVSTVSQSENSFEGITGGGMSSSINSDLDAFFDFFEPHQDFLDFFFSISPASDIVSRSSSSLSIARAALFSSSSFCMASSVNSSAFSSSRAIGNSCASSPLTFSSCFSGPLSIRFRSSVEHS